MEYRVCVTKYGYADIEADSKEKAVEIAENQMTDHGFDWSDLCDAKIVEEYDDWY